LFAAFISVIVIGFLVLALLATPLIKSATVNQISAELLKQVALVGQDITDLVMQKVSDTKLQNKVLKVARLTNSRVTIISADGIVLADSGTPFDQVKNLENHGNRPEVVEARDKGQGRSSRFSNTLNKELIYVAVPLKNSGNNIIGYLRFSVNETYAAGIVLKIQKAAVVALVIAVLVALILSMFFSRSFSLPIIRLSQAAKMIAQGQFPITILHHSRFEVGILEQSVEEMSKKLAKSFQKLSNERTQISTIVSSMAEGVLAVDINNKIILANPVIEKIFSVVVPEILTKNVREVIRNNEISDLLVDVLQAGHLVNRELKIILPVERIFLAQASPILTHDGKIQGAVCVLYDVTNLRKLEQYRSEFVANVSHELKTPLTSISGYIETLLDGAVDDKDNTIKFIKKIEKHTRNLTTLINDILEVSHLESKQELGPFQEVDITGLVNRAVESVAGAAKAKDIKIVKCCASEPCLMMGIEEHIYRAVLNLLDNAVNYTSAGGRVEISCARKDNGFEIAVADSGIGIPQEHLDRIFERFYRVDTARSKELGGTGLGLSIVKHVMNIHNGTVIVESHVGQGSKFTLFFPA